ncbi:uncharacterized protein LOC123555840 [Mercenaria mercenaria]|uniref:uncharacterized protein LOC123555840 n=1 Tax=Mercenaria mercenaria TaxID=6596 RepID=UPI00234ED10E|nr:uncharacterized protein LOC123555840 [Mercenaria mercenaria]
MILSGTDICQETGPEYNLTDIASSMTQLLVFNAAKRVKMYKTLSHPSDREIMLPLHIDLTVHNKTRRNDLIDILYKNELSVSYDRVLRIFTSVASAVITMYEDSGVKCPPIIQENGFIQVTVSSRVNRTFFRIAVVKGTQLHICIYVGSHIRDHTSNELNDCVAAVRRCLERFLKSSNVIFARMSRQVGATPAKARRQQYEIKALEHAAGFPYGGHKVGHKTILTDQEETRIANWATHMARIGYGRTRQELLNTVKKILDEDGRPNLFKNNRPGKEWLSGIFKRHPDLSLRTTIQLGKERAIISPEKVSKWFEDFKHYIEEEVGDKDLLNDPSRIYNADETGVSLCTKGNQVIVLKGAPVVYHYGNSDKTQLTIMASCSASGHYITPLLIFPGQRFSYNPLEGFEEAALGRSENGWMDSEVFCNWLENVFIPGINERKVKKPVLLLIDGHSTHITMDASDICLQNGIELYCLLEHASHVMQPLDLRLFSALKKSWKQSVRDWQSEHIGEYVTKVTFARVFKAAWKQSTTTDAAVKGFAEAGLFPLDPTVVTQSVKIEPSKMFLSDNQYSATKEKQSNEMASNVSTEDKDEIKGTGREPLAEPQQTENDASTDSGTIEESRMEDTEERDHENIDPETSKTEIPNTDLEMKERNIRQSPEDVKEKKNTSTASPFSKHLSIPSPKVAAKSKVVKRLSIPKAITGSAYRKMMQDKIAQKEKDALEKEKRKEERLQKRKLKEEMLAKKKAESEAKRKRNAQEKEQKQQRREMRERLMQARAVLEDSSSDDNDNAVPIDRRKCYTCDSAYTTDFIECVSCFRRFHIECVDDDYLNVEGLPFECKYC